MGQTTLEHDEPPQLNGSLVAQLEQIAAAHGGNVPIHGRLFAQWLHYVFPRECPFPHKARSIPTFSPNDLTTYFASDEELLTKAIIRNETIMEASDLEEAKLMAQWNEEEEELLADYSALRRAPWQNIYVV